MTITKRKNCAKKCLFLINEKIVLVTTFSQHRDDSFQACNFIMDYLKKDAPFWKKEIYKNEYNWLENSN